MSMVVHDVDNCDARHRHAVGVILDLALQNGELRAELRKVAPERADAIDDMHRARNAPQPTPSVPADAEVAEVLAEVLAAIGTYDQLMFSDQHRALFGRAAATGARVAGGEPERDEQIRIESAAACWEAQVKRPIRDRIASLLRESDQKDAVESVIADAGDPNVGYCGGQTYDPPCGGCAGCLVAQALYYLPSWEQYLAVADQALAMDAAAPPTPAAHGVAELLAEARRRRGDREPYLYCDEIVRLLARDGQDMGLDEPRHSPTHQSCCSTPDVRCTRWCAECDTTLESGCPADALRAQLAEIRTAMVAFQAAARAMRRDRDRLSVGLRAMARRSVEKRQEARFLARKRIDTVMERGDILRAIHAAAGVTMAPFAGVESAVAVVLAARSEAATLRSELSTLRAGRVSEATERIAQLETTLADATEELTKAPLRPTTYHWETYAVDRKALIRRFWAVLANEEEEATAEPVDVWEGEPKKRAYRCPYCERLTEWWSDREQLPGNCPWCEVAWELPTDKLTHPPSKACVHCASPARLASADPVIDCPRSECPHVGDCVRCGHDRRHRWDDGACREHEAADLDPTEVRAWLDGSTDPGPGPVDDPARLAERIQGLRAHEILRRLVELHDITNSGVLDLNAWDAAWTEARALLGGESG